MGLIPMPSGLNDAGDMIDEHFQLKSQSVKGFLDKIDTGELTYAISFAPKKEFKTYTIKIGEEEFTITGKKAVNGEFKGGILFSDPSYYQNYHKGNALDANNQDDKRLMDMISAINISERQKDSEKRVNKVAKVTKNLLVSVLGDPAKRKTA